MKKEKSKQKSEVKAWIVSVDMGYGHQRAAYALKHLAYEQIITANNHKIISQKEKKLWDTTRKFYESVSRLSNIPIIGQLTFGFYDSFQKIKPLFPYRDLSKSNWAVKRIKKLISKGLCKSIIDYTSQNNLPVITTHFIPALAYHYSGKEVFCVVTDSDINRVWVPEKPSESKITYFSSCGHATLRLKEYGVPENRIIETGFPLPKQNVGLEKSTIKKDLISRIANLDPNGIFFEKYKGLIADKILNKNKISKKDIKSNHKLTITFMVGGAGAQKEVGIQFIKSVIDDLRLEKININLVAGTKIEIKQYFEKELLNLGLEKNLNKNIKILFALKMDEYFELINSEFRTTDIIWSKPSEISFYTGLGIPIIMTQPIGDHENFNRSWILHIGSGIDQENPEYANNWLNYWLSDGRLADCAIQGFIDAPSNGVYAIENYLINNIK